MEIGAIISLVIILSAFVISLAIACQTIESRETN